MRIRFGDFVLDTDCRELLRGTQEVPLRPKALQLLQILIENRPRAVSQQELYDALWPETFVQKTNLHKLMHHLRDAIDDQEQAIIRTAYGFGFSFAAIASEESPRVTSTSWQVVIGDHEFDLSEGENIVGRDHDAVIRIDAPSISRRHARILITGNQVTIEDLGSKNGTCVQGKRVHQGALCSGDSILFGTVAAAFRAIVPASSTETVP